MNLTSENWRDDMLELLEMVEAKRLSPRIAREAVRAMHDEQVRLHPLIDIRTPLPKPDPPSE